MTNAAFHSLCFCVLCLLVPSAVAAPPEQPSEKEANEALRDVFKQLGKSSLQPMEVRTILGCYPIVKRPLSELICLLDIAKQGGTPDITEAALSKNKDSWAVLIAGQDLSPACPQKKEAEKLLGDFLHDPQTRVKDVPAEGNFTEDRGMNRDKSGPRRLMCVYGIGGTLGDRTVVGYFRYENGKYLIDPDAEIWPD